MRHLFVFGKLPCKCITICNAKNGDCCAKTHHGVYNSSFGRTLLQQRRSRFKVKVIEPNFKLEGVTMIEFEGIPSGKLRKHIISANKKLGLISSLFGVIVASAIIIYLTIKFNQPIILLGGFVWLALFVVLMALQPFKKDVPKLFATKLTIFEDGKMIAVGYDQSYHNSVEFVKKVLDVGDGYVFEFMFKARNPYFHCQKSQITKGTIEQFEELFKDKIVRLDSNS